MTPNTVSGVWRRVLRGAPDECWPWIGHASPYGLFWIEGKPYGAHRVAFQAATGIDPAGFLICHSCDNPPCCNPAHLFIGTGKDNTQDALSKGRLVFPRGSRHGQSKLIEDQVRAIRRRRAAGERGCRLAAEFGVSPPTITRIVKGYGWEHVPGPRLEHEEAAA